MHPDSFPKCRAVGLSRLFGWVLAGSLAFGGGAPWARGAEGAQSGGAAEAGAGGLSATANHHIRIPRSQFDREFMLSASVIPQVVSPTSRGLSGKIVRFEKFADGVDLYESNAGWVVTDVLPARRLLTTFPIVGEDGDSVVIDFNAGMRRVFQEEWYARGDGFDPASGSRAMEIPLSRVFEVQTQGASLVIRQSAQVRDRQSDPNREERYEIRYFLTPYAAGTVKQKENVAASARYVRFFQTHSLLEKETGRSASKIALFDLKKPLVFHYSAGTPPEFEQAVRDGVLYWNRAFGKEVIRVEKAPEGVSAPDARYNLVQWVPWEDAGAAYADLLIDPRSGAALLGQAHVPSAFAFLGKARARTLLRSLRGAMESKSDKPDSPPKGEKPDPAPGPASRGEAGFLAPSRMCEVSLVELARVYGPGLEALLASDGLEEKAVLSVAQDFVRNIVAHEVGHVLGLRHNFAGSLSATLSRRELQEWFKAYVVNPDVELYADRFATSSVMDYNDLRASVFNGAKIRRSKEMLPYDRAAIRWGYLDDEEVVAKRTLFATDEDTRVFGDVRVFDYGPDPVVGAYVAMAERLATLPNSVIESFIFARAPRDARDLRPLEAVNLDPRVKAGEVLADWAAMLNWFRAGARSLRVEREFPYSGELNRREVLQAHWKALNQQLEKLGGVDRAVFSFLPMDWKLDLKAPAKEVEALERVDAEKLSERLAKLLESKEYSTFVGLDEKTYSFSKEEKDLILERGRRYFGELEKALVKGAVQILEKLPRDLGVQATDSVGEDDAVARLERRLLDFAREIILRRNEEERRRGRVDRAQVEVVDFKYDLETRLAAARALADSAGSFKGWSVDAKGELHRMLKEAVDASLNIQNFREFQDSQLSRPLRDWYLNQQNILSLLPPKRPAGGGASASTGGGGSGPGAR
ncbi:MAG: hypothetical protein RLZZ244_394 [Verrucomicrobiota bacterium]